MNTEFYDYNPNNVQPLRFDDPGRHAIAMREATEVTRFKSDRGQAFSGLDVNRSHNDQPAIIRANSLFGDSNNVEQQYIAYQYAAAFPEHRIITIDMPANGGSDLLTQAQLFELKKTGTVETVGKAQIEAVSKQLPDTKSVWLVGEAIGSRLAIEFAAQAALRDIRPEHLFGIDTPGLEKRSSLGMGLGYLISAVGSSGVAEHLEAGLTKFKAEAAELGSIQEVRRREEVRVLTRQKQMAKFFLGGSPMANDSGAESLEKALDAEQQLAVSLVFGGMSVVGRLTPRVQQKLGEIAEKTDYRLHWTEWPEDSQNIGLAPQHPRIIKYIQDRVRVAD